MTKAERKILEDALNEIKNKESECFRKIAFLNEHKFELERVSVQYVRETYTESRLILSSALGHQPSKLKA